MRFVPCCNCWHNISYQNLDYSFLLAILQKIRCPLMRRSGPGTLIIHNTSMKVLILKVENNPPLVNWHPQIPTQQPAHSSLPLPPNITKLSSCSMKHLFLFLFDMGDSIKASGSKCCNTRLSVEMSKNVTLCHSKRKKIAYIPLSLALLTPEVLNKQDLYPWPRNASKSTCLLGLAVKCRAVLAA